MRLCVFFPSFMLSQPLLARTNPCYGGGPCVSSGQALGAGIVLGNGEGQANQIYTNDPSTPRDPSGTLAIRRQVQ